MATAGAASPTLGARAVAWVLGAVAVVGLPMLAWPFGRDQGNYAYPAWRLLEGEVPYRDVYVFKPPGTVLLHALSQAAFGHSMAAVRALDLGLLAFSAVGLAVLVVRAGGSRVAAVAAGVWMAWLHTGAGHWDTAQTDPWFTPFTVAALLAITAPRAGAWHALIAGAALGFIAVLKYTGLAFALPVAVAWALRGDRAPAARMRDVAAGAGGLVGVMGATGLWLVASGAWHAFVESQQLVLSYSVEASGFDPVRAFGWQVKKFPTTGAWPVLAAGGALAGVLAVRRDRGQVRAAAVVVAWAVAALVSIAVQRRYFLYHHLVLAPVLAVGGGVAVDAFGRWVSGRWQIARDVVVGGVLAVALFGAVALRPDGWGPFLDWTQRGDAVHARFRSPQMTHPFGWFLEGAAWLRERAAPDDPVFMFGFDPVVLFLAERRQVSRFLYSYPIVVRWADDVVLDELVGALERERPVVIGLARRDAALKVTGTRMDSREAWHARPALRRITDDDYVRLDGLRGYEAWVRRDRAGGLR